MPGIVQAALLRRERWSDPTYLARIIFCELITGQEDEPTGFGISTSIGDNEYPITVVDCSAQRVYVVEEEELIDGRLPENAMANRPSYTFEEYATRPVPAIR
jgi:hypothetical protein